ncbi:MAG: DUF4234 domain-containing protein [Spirochaetaceae bacterium]|nr:DUF4234 domain-containing protein [Spirochaetaceae bacterium]
MINERNFWLDAALMLVTLGLYSAYWSDKIAHDVNIICAGDGKTTKGGLMVLLLGLVTFGLYGLVWLYELGNRLQENGDSRNITINESGGAYVLITLVGGIIFGIFVALYALTQNFNKLALAYNS